MSEHTDPYDDYDNAEKWAIANGDCPDCGEKINSKDCCCYTGE